MKSRGVTLTELMVVVAIVAIIAAIATRVNWRRDDARVYARKVQMAIFNARREALTMGIQKFPGPIPPADTPRAACMPNTRLRVTATQVLQFNCALNTAASVACFPCVYSGSTCASALADDCTWSATAIRTFQAPMGYEITRAETQAQNPGGPGAWTNIALPFDIYFSPGGITDTTLGPPRETVRLYIRATSLTDESRCTAETGRCFLVLTETSKIGARWP